MPAQQSIFGRIAQLARANINNLLDAAEDPQVMIDQMIRDYTDNIQEAEAAISQTLGNLRLTWYSHIDPDETVEIVNTLRNRALNGETVFYDIYTESEKTADPDKRDTGLFFFKGTPGAKFAVCNAGGGFAYVGAMHDSFPHAFFKALLSAACKACGIRALFAGACMSFST